MVSRKGLGQSVRNSKMVQPVKVEDLQAAFEIFARLVSKAEARASMVEAISLPGLVDADDFRDPFSDDPADAAMGDLFPELEKLGHDEEAADTITGRAYGLFKIMQTMKRADLTPEILAVAANLPLPGGTSQFPTAEFLKALKKASRA